MGPFKPIRPGQSLKARDLNRVQDTAESLLKITAAPPLEVQRDAGGGHGVHLRLNQLDPIWAKITGTGGTGAPGFCYTGTQLLDSQTAAAAPLTTGLAFTGTSFPLVEISGATTVPVDGSVVVRAFPGSDGSFYGFRIASVSDGRTTAIVHVDDVHQVGPGSRKHYPSFIDEYDTATGVDSDGDPVWLVAVEDGDLATDGHGYYLAILRGSVEVNDDTRPVYETPSRIYLTGIACVDGAITPTTHGHHAEPGQLDFTAKGNSSLFTTLFSLAG